MKKKSRLPIVLLALLSAVAVGIPLFQTIRQVQLSPSDAVVDLSPVSGMFVAFAGSFVMVVVIGLVVYYVLVNKKDQVE